MSKDKANAILSEIEQHQTFNEKYAQEPVTVGAYFKKYESQCLKKFSNTSEFSSNVNHVAKKLKRIA